MSVISLRNVSGAEEKARLCENAHCAPLFPPQVTSQDTTVYRMFLWSSSFHLHVTSSCSSSSHVCFRTCLCDVCWVRSWFWFNTFIYTIFILYKTQLWHHLYFPYALDTEIRNHLKLMKLSSVPLLVFPNCQQPSWTLHIGLIITQLCVISKTSLSPSSFSPRVHTWL